MSAFTALNVEPDNTFDDNVDDTREIQIEEALKLYQSALKLHSQGPQYYEQAGANYDALFKSEIFRYPESVTEFTRYDENPQLDLDPELSFQTGADFIGAGSDGSPSTLPQILYLAYKNHGQFIMDCVKHQIRRGDSIPQDILLPQAHMALIQFSQALARDESDTELWRRAARIGALLGSRAIARYCLEAAVEVDDDPTQSEVEPAGIEEGFAGMQLKEHLTVLSDEVALSHPIMAPYNKKTMSATLRKYMDPYPFLPEDQAESSPAPADIAQLQGQRMVVELPERSWCGVSEALWRISMINYGSGASILITMPEGDDEMAEVSNLPDDSIPHRPAQTGGTKVSNFEEVPDSNGARNPTNLVVPEPRTEEEAQAEPSSVQSTDKSVEQDRSVGARKRSQSAAGIQEGADEEANTQKRSKRIRNRDTINNEATPPDPATQFQDQLFEVKQADDHVFNYINSLLKKLDIRDLGTIEELQSAITADKGNNREEILQNTAIRDLRDVLQSWNDNNASILMSGGGLDVLGASNGGANAGILAFLEHSKAGSKKSSERPMFPATTGLSSFVDSVNERWLSLVDVAYEFLRKIHCSYIQRQWPELLKHTVCRLINRLDPELFGRFQEEAEYLLKRDDWEQLRVLQSLVQMLFEIHLDIYASITEPNSVIDYAIRIKEKDSLERWRTLISDLISDNIGDPMDDLTLRYLWSSAFFASMADGASREHVISCWSDLQGLLEKAGNPTIELQNNAVMPEISASAAEREISRLTSMDFFLGLFQSDTADPVAIIETLEPVLDPVSAGVSHVSGTSETPKDSEDSPVPTAQASSVVPTGLRDMWKFLQSGSTSLRLFLWQRLREAYQTETVKYPSKVFSCHLKSLEIIVADLRSAAYVDGSVESRQHTLLSWFKIIDDLLVRALTLALNDSTSFEVIDDTHMRTTTAALTQLCRILHSAAIFDDGARVGMIQLPRTASYSAQGTFNTALIKLREMQVRSWALLYTLIKDGMSQNRESFPAMDSDLADYMAAVHYSLGLRKYCRVSNKIFLKMMKVELVRMKTIERWEDYIGQVLFDLYGIRLGVGTYELQDHGCPSETLDKRTTVNIADRVITLANSMPMKDLLKAELRPTIEKMQQSIGKAKESPQMQHNLRNYTEYLKSSINPLRMIEALKGKVLVDSVPVTTSESPLAEKGWYFLHGMIALAKFRSQKRLSPGATDDLKVAASFFRLQLQFTSELWETWYRLAQCFDAELEEEVLWSADKINTEKGHSGPLIQLQRSSIHCYVMAVSSAVRSADASLETASKISDMYHDFGVRLYSSSREPFEMKAFYLQDFERHFNSTTLGTYRKMPHKEMTNYQVWRYAVNLFQRALKGMPNSWMTHYMLGKCLWKMYKKFRDNGTSRIRYTRPSMKSVINAFERAIETVPRPRDSRTEPILEPHYKIMSIVHKLVICGDLGPQDAANILQRQPFALRKGESVIVSDTGTWGKFILDSLRHLRNADKANWHHRMIYRAARIQCPDSSTMDYTQANNARAELKESMFTKTMVVQVWKPEYERPGRHCVYMHRYVKFMAELLLLLDDKPNMEALIKRVRKKQADYYQFEEIWTECCNIYMTLLRRAGKVMISHDDTLKAIPSDEFAPIADALEVWCRDPASSHPALECLREASELKKLNSSLPKAAAIDELINDAYATIILDVGVNLPRAPPRPPSPAAEVRSQGPMSLNNLVSNMDGTGQMQFPSVMDATARPRHKGVSRREIIRRAEALVARAPEAARPANQGRARASDQSLVLGSNMKSPVVGPVQPRATAALREEETIENAGESSAPGSLHDSADDESDLSDVPDIEEEAAPAYQHQEGDNGTTEAEGEGGSVMADVQEDDFQREG